MKISSSSLLFKELRGIPLKLENNLTCYDFCSDK